MEDIYYFSQGRLIHNVPYKKFVDTKDVDNVKDKVINDNKGKSIFNFKIFNASILRYK